MVKQIDLHIGGTLIWKVSRRVQTRYSLNEGMHTSTQADKNGKEKGCQLGRLSKPKLVPETVLRFREQERS